jgi:UDPglucose 6-dehydrogenase
MKVGFVGVGKLGKDAAEVLAEYYDVVGYDINEVKTTIPMCKTLEQCVEGKDIVFIAVPTAHHPDYDGRHPSSHLPPKDFDYSIAKNVTAEVDKLVDSNTLIVMISTMLPGTVRREIAPIIENGRFIYNPYLIAQGTVKWDMRNPEMIMIGTEDGSETGDAKLLADFYLPILDKETRFELGTWEEVESMKIFYNTFITAKLCLVNMIQDAAMAVGNMNVDKVTGALKRSTDRIMGPKYMMAGLGDGGGCVLPSFVVNVNGKKQRIEDLYWGFNEDEVFLVDSMNYSGSKKDQKKIDVVTSRHYKDKMYTFTTIDGSITTTKDHLIPVLRNNKRIILRADEIKMGDKLFIDG